MTPRIWTPPLRPLLPPVRDDDDNVLVPATSVGYDQVEFAREILHRPPDPWQEWLWIHAGELLPDGRPRFRVVLVIVSRQNGKTETPVILSAYWQFVQGVPLILGTSTKLDYAKESWTKAVKLVEAAPDLTELRPKNWTREANGEQVSWTSSGSRYKIAASNAEGGRSLTVHRLVCDELRMHHDYSAWDAAEPATSAVADAQIWALSNAGDDRSVVLNDHRSAALDFIKWADEVGSDNVAGLLDQAPADWRLGIFEWSAPEDADPTDLEALAMANPNLGHRIDPEALLLKARRAVKLGGEVLAGFKTEHMCIRVPKLAAEPDAIAQERWAALLDAQSQPGPDVAFAVDIEPNRGNASIVVYSMRPDGRGHLEVVAYRPGVAWIIPTLVLLKKLHDPVAIAIDSKGPGGSLIAAFGAVGITPPLLPDHPARGDLAIMRANDVAEAWGQFLDAVAPDADALRHIGQVPLDAAVSNAKTRKLGEAEALTRRTAAGDISPLVAGVAARWAFFERISKIVEPEPDPGVWIL